MRGAAALIPACVAFALTACNESPTGTIPIPPTLPSLESISSVQFSPTDVRLEGTINPQGAPTAYYFEYGATASYGSFTTNRDAGSGVSSVPVVATLSELVTGSTLHWRLVAVSAAGRTTSPDTTFIVMREVVIPQALGATWRYRYIHRVDGSNFVNVRGTHTWTLVTRTVTPDSIILKLTDMMADSTFSVDGYLTLRSDTAFAVISLTTTQIAYNAPEGIFTLPRYCAQASDTATVYPFTPTTLRHDAVTCVSQIGLIQDVLVWWIGGPNYENREIDLLAFSQN